MDTQEGNKVTESKDGGLHATIFILAFFVLIVPTNFVNAAMMSPTALFCCTISLVPKCIVTTSAGFLLSQPSS